MVKKINQEQAKQYNFFMVTKTYASLLRVESEKALSIRGTHNFSVNVFLKSQL